MGSNRLMFKVETMKIINRAYITEQYNNTNSTMKRIITILAAILFAVTFSLKSCNCQPQTERIEQTINQLVFENEIPGLNLSIIDSLGNQSNFSAGYADQETKTDLTQNHIMFSGSIGKTYAVAVLFQLIEEGKIDLKQKLITYFLDLGWLKQLPNIEDITIEMLLRHTSGLPRYISEPQIWETVKTNPDKIWSYKDRLSVLFNSKPIHKPGRAWSYSDTNYILLGMLIEEITGKNYYDLVNERVIAPMGLHATYPANKRKIENIAVGYSEFKTLFDKTSKVIFDGKYCFNPQMEWTGGGFVCSTPDLAKWAKIFYEHKLFSEESFSEIVTVNPNGTNVMPMASYGTGSFIYETSLGKAYGHTGFVPGFVSIFAYYPKQKKAVAMQINCDYAKRKMNLIEYLNRITAIK